MTLHFVIPTWTDFFVRKPRSVSHQEPADDIQFDVPDVVTEYASGHEKIFLEAFKVRNRTSNEKPKWVSVGYPTLMNNSKGEIFHFTPEHIMVFVKTLDPSQKQALFIQASRQYPPGLVFPENIIPLPLVQFGCTVQFFVDGSSHEIRGSVYDLRRSPFLLKFPFNQNHKKRYLLQKRLLQVRDPLHFECELAATGKQEKINTLKITLDQLTQFGLADELLGHQSEEKYILHRQLIKITQSLKSYLRIEENYEIDNDEFDEQFVQKILDKSTNWFRFVPIDDVFGKISKFGMTGEQRRLAPNELKRQLSNLLEIKNGGTKNVIVVIGNSENRDRSSLISDLTGVDDSVGFVSGKYHDWSNDNSSVEDQLREINEKSSECVEWKIDGMKIVPISLHVAKMTRSGLSQQMVFTRIKRRLSTSKYYRTYELVSKNRPDRDQSNNNSTEIAESAAAPPPDEKIQYLQQSPFSLQQDITDGLSAAIQDLNRSFTREIQNLKDVFALSAAPNRIDEPFTLFHENMSDLVQNPDSFLEKLKNEIRTSMLTTCVIKTSGDKRGVSAKLWVPWDNIAFKNIDCGNESWYVTNVKWDRIENKSTEGVVHVLAHFDCCPRGGGECMKKDNANFESGTMLKFPHVVDRYSSGRHVLVEVADAINCDGPEWYINGIAWDSVNESIDEPVTTQVSYNEQYWDERSRRNAIRIAYRTEVAKPRQEAYFLKPKYRCCKRWDWLPLKDFECGNGNWYINDMQWVKWEKRNGTNGKNAWAPLATYNCCSRESGECIRKIED